jgi:putative peptide zinc metalloprotease protein
MNITSESTMTLHPLNIRKEKKYYIVEDLETSEFYEMPEVCVVAIRSIMEGGPLGKIEEELSSKFPTETVNLVEFARQLVELEMVKEIDGIALEERKGLAKKQGFVKVTPAMGKFFFNKYSKIIYFVLFILNISILTIHPNLFPHYKDVFVYDVIFQNIFVWFVIGGILVFIHELGHIISIRAHDLSTNLTVGHRLFLLVLETDLSLGWKLSPKERITLYLAGVCFDNVILFLALLIQLLFPNSSDVFLGVMAFIVLDILIRFIYQCCVYMKTDFYYVLENLTECNNLMENAKALIFKRKSEITIFEGERRAIYIYTAFYLVGLIVSFSLLIFYFIPQFIYTLQKIAPGFREPVVSVPFLDAVFIILQAIIVIGLLVRSWWKTYSKRI